MIQSTTLEKAISEAFNIDGRKVPKFTSSKPVKQAREWLVKEGFEVEYKRGELKAGSVCVYTYGASNPMYTVVSEGDELKGATILAGLSATKKSKSQERREAVQNEENADDETPEVVSAPEPQSEPQTTVVDDKSKRSSRRKR